MPISFAQMVSNTGQVTFTWLGESVTIEYYPGLVTEETFAALMAFDTMDSKTFVSTFHSLNDMLAELIKSWDAFEDLERTIPMPITAERLVKTPLFFRMRLLQAIIEDIRPEAIAPQG